MNYNNGLTVAGGFCDVAGGVPLTQAFLLFVKEGDQDVAFGDPDTGAQVVDPSAEVVLDSGEVLGGSDIVFGNTLDLHTYGVASGVVLRRTFEDDRKVALFTELTYTLAPAAVDVAS